MERFEGYDPEKRYPFAMRTSLWNVSYQAEQLAEWLWEALQPASVIDIGCGPGCYLAPFKRYGCEILGVDACESAGALIPGDFRLEDLRFPYSPPRRFDLALCIEVAEHLEEAYSGILLDSLNRCADTIAFSAAVPGQAGDYHINLQPPEYWLEKLGERGYGIHPAHDEMRRFLETLRPASPECTDGCHRWLRDNSYLLVRGEAS